MTPEEERDLLRQIGRLNAALGRLIAAEAGSGSGTTTPLSSATPQAVGTAAAGTSGSAARGDHVHALPYAYASDTYGASAANTLQSDTNGRLRLDALSVGSGAIPTQGRVIYSGDLQNVRASTTYTGYIFVPLTTPVLVYSATTFSTVGTSTEITYSTLGTPAAAKALMCQIIVKDSGGSGYEFDIGPSATYYYAIQSYTQVAAKYNATGGFCPTDSNGSVWYRSIASGANTLTVYFRVWGYFI